MTIKIDKDLTPPEPVTGRPRKYPFPEMAIGDSFAIPLSGNNTAKGEDHAASKLRSSAILYARKKGGKFTVRTDRKAGKARCWRIA